MPPTRGRSEQGNLGTVSGEDKTADDNSIKMTKQKIELSALIGEMSKNKEAFILEELKPYFENGQIIEMVKIRLAEIKDFKEQVNEKFKEFIFNLKDELLEGNTNGYINCEEFQKTIDKLIGNTFIK